MFACTKQEKRVIVFLTALALFGTGISYLSKRFAPIKAVACVNENLGKININTADKDMLKRIPGIGEKIAARIIAYRLTYGAFSCPEDLKNIKGFHNRTFEKARNAIFAE